MPTFDDHPRCSIEIESVRSPWDIVQEHLEANQGRHGLFGFLLAGDAEVEQRWWNGWREVDRATGPRAEFHVFSALASPDVVAAGTQSLPEDVARTTGDRAVEFLRRQGVPAASMPCLLVYEVLEPGACVILELRGHEPADLRAIFDEYYLPNRGLFGLEDRLWELRAERDALRSKVASLRSALDLVIHVSDALTWRLGSGSDYAQYDGSLSAGAVRHYFRGDRDILMEEDVLASFTVLQQDLRACRHPEAAVLLIPRVAAWRAYIQSCVQPNIASRESRLADIEAQYREIVDAVDAQAYTPFSDVTRKLHIGNRVETLSKIGEQTAKFAGALVTHPVVLLLRKLIV